MLVALPVLVDAADAHDRQRIRSRRTSQCSGTSPSHGTPESFVRGVGLEVQRSPCAASAWRPSGGRASGVARGVCVSRSRARTTASWRRRSRSSRGGSSVRYSATWMPLRPRSRYSTVSRFLPAQRMRAMGFPRLLALVTVEPAQVQLHLAGVGRLEVADLQLDDHQPPQPAMVEQEVDVVIVAVQRDALLALDEGEPGAELEQERLDLAQDGGFQILLAVRVLQSEKVEDVGIAETSRGESTRRATLQLCAIASPVSSRGRYARRATIDRPERRSSSARCDTFRRGAAAILERDKGNEGVHVNCRISETTSAFEDLGNDDPRQILRTTAPTPLPILPSSVCNLRTVQRSAGRRHSTQRMRVSLGAAR